MLGPALALAVGLSWIPLYVFRPEEMRDALPYYSGAERRWVRGGPAIIAAHVTLGCVLLSFADPSPWLAAVGAALGAAGVAFWFWGRAQIGPLRVTRLPDEPPRELQRHGAFGLVRHPLYLGYLVIAAVPVIVAGRPILLCTLAGCFVVLAVRADQEERRLNAQLGAPYAEYCRTVKRLIPFVW